MILNQTELIDNYLASIPLKYKNYTDFERNILKKLLSLIDISNFPLNNSFFELKSKLLSAINKNTKGKNFTKAKAVFLTNPMFFGNNIIVVNTIMNYCELYGIKNIYFDSKYNWFIKNNITSKLFNISSKYINCNDTNIICLGLSSNFFFYYYPSFIKPQIKINILKNEIKK